MYIAQLIKNPLAMQETLVWFLGQEDPWRRDRLPTPVFLGFPCGSAGKESACDAGDLGSIPGLGRSPEEGKGYPLQYSGLEKSMDCIGHGVAESDTTERLSLSLICKCKPLLQATHSGPFSITLRETGESLWMLGDLGCLSLKHSWRWPPEKSSLQNHPFWSILPTAARELFTVFLKILIMLLTPCLKAFIYIYSLEEGMATHYSILAWEIPWTEDLGGLQSTGSQRVGHDWATSLHFTSLHFIHLVGMEIGDWYSYN